MFDSPAVGKLFKHIGYPMTIDMYECDGMISRHIEDGSIIGKFSSPEMMYGTNGGPWIGNHSAGSTSLGDKVNYIVGGVESFSIKEHFVNESFSPTFNLWMSQFFEVSQKYFESRIRLPLSKV